MSLSDGRRRCILFLSCFGGLPKHFLQLSQKFRRQYKLVTYIYNHRDLLSRMYGCLEKEFWDDPLLIYHGPDWVPFAHLPKDRAPYEEFITNIPANVTKISYPAPRFPLFWPFHCTDPRNVEPNRARNRYGIPIFFPTGDRYVLRLIKQGLSSNDIIAHYLALDLSRQVDLEQLLQRTIVSLERCERNGPIKVADYVATRFRSESLFQSIQHPSMRLILYITNQVLKLLQCDGVSESVLKSLTEMMERPVPVHPSISRHFEVAYLNENTRYPVDDIQNITFAEYIGDYVHYAAGTFNDGDRLITAPNAR